MKAMQSAKQELSFRTVMAVTQLRLFPKDGAYPVCPRCQISLEREYQRFCDHCGQRLGWKGYRKAQIVYPKSMEGT